MAFGASRTILALSALASVAHLRAQDFAPITVTWRHTVTVIIPNVTRVVPFEESICGVEVVNDHIKLEGLARGTTPLFIWQGDKQSTVIIHVVEEEELPSKASLQRHEDGRSNGIFSTDLQYSNQSARLQQLLVANRLDWTEQTGANKLRLQIQAESGPSFQASGTDYNVRTASVQYITQHTTFSALDFVEDVSGGIRSQMTPYLSSSTLLLRGAGFQTKVHNGLLSVFAGATLPPRFFYYGGTRDIAGVSWHSSFSERVQYSMTTAATSVPLRVSASGIFARTLSYYSLLALHLQASKRLQAELVGGISNRGALVQGAASYSTNSFTAFATSTFSSLDFPLNQLRLLPSGHLTASGGMTAAINRRLTGTLLIQDTTRQNGVLLAAQGSSQHVNPSFSLLLTNHNRLTLNYTFDRTTGTLESAGRSTGNRIDADWSSQLASRFSNTLRVSKGSLSDPFAVNSRATLWINESLNWRPSHERALKGLSFLTSYNRANTPLAAKLLQDLSLLTPALQQLYYLDPVGFLQQQNLPPGLLNLLQALRPTNLSVEVDGQFAFGSRILFNPSISYMHSVQSLSSQSKSPSVSFNFQYQFTARTSLHASLTNTFLLNNISGQLQRVSLFSFGINQGLSGVPHWMTGMAGVHGVILGRVFRDNNESGAYRANDGTYEGLHVVLSNGLETYTDAQGRYRFDKLPLGEYSVRLPISQFAKSIRLTTPADYKFDLRRFRTAQADFGLIDFSSVRGSVYNDYLNVGYREPDAAGIADVRVILSNGKTKWEQVCDSAGEFEFKNLETGTYQLSLDTATIPDNYQAAQVQPTNIEVQPARSVTADIPLVALRSIQGFVLRQVKNREEVEPVPGVVVKVGEKTAFTNKEGSFLIRDLPAGDLTLQLVPATPLPPGKKAPSGTIHVTRGPMEGRGIRILISDDELLHYLVNHSK